MQHVSARGGLVGCYARSMSGGSFGILLELRLPLGVAQRPGWNMATAMRPRADVAHLAGTRDGAVGNQRFMLKRPNVTMMRVDDGYLLLQIIGARFQLSRLRVAILGGRHLTTFVM